MDTLTRRTLLAAAPASLTLAMTPALAMGTDLGDSATRARMRARIIGSCAAETVFLFYRLHIYGYTGQGNLIPFFTMNNLNISEWTPLAGDRYQSKSFESGVYCRFNTDEPLDE